MASTILSSSFILQRKRPLQFLSDFLQVHSADPVGVQQITKTKGKRLYNDIARGTRGFQSRKTPRLLSDKINRKRLKQSPMSLLKRSRKVQRRPAILLSERTMPNNNGKNTLLRTHLWHAKRMRMKEYYGCVIAASGNGRSLNAVQRYYNNRCLLQDVSYLRRMELIGERDDLVRMLENLMVKVATKYALAVPHVVTIQFVLKNRLGPRNNMLF